MRSWTRSRPMASSCGAWASRLRGLAGARSWCMRFPLRTRVSTPTPASVRWWPIWLAAGSAGGPTSCSPLPRPTPAGPRSRPASGWSSGRCASCCSACSPPIFHPMMCTGAPQSCSCPARSWSAGLAGAKVPVLLGPTAVGKTAVALALAAHWPLEVVSADSRQVYRRLDIGTAKPTRKERARTPHHGIDLIDPGSRYSAGHFTRDAVTWLDDIRTRGKQPVLVGGTGLYVRALSEGLFAEPSLDPAKRRSLDAWTARLEPLELLRWAFRLDPGFRGGGRQRAARAIEVALLSGHPLSYWQQAARSRGMLDPWYIVLTVPRPVLHQRIARRAEDMVRRGLIEEVASVLAEGHAPNAPGLDGIGIREAVEYLHGKRARDTVAQAITIGTRQYAKRQETWFRHQLTGQVVMLDATRPPEKLAAEITQMWENRILPRDRQARPVASSQ